jgi:hypothetical protein
MASASNFWILVRGCPDRIGTRSVFVPTCLSNPIPDEADCYVTVEVIKRNGAQFQTEHRVLGGTKRVPKDEEDDEYTWIPDDNLHFTQHARNATWTLQFTLYYAQPGQAHRSVAYVHWDIQVGA